ncbi:MAG: glycine cleavage system aminomethyltransferase GcvT, partial [Bacillota bacterium]
VSHMGEILCEGPDALDNLNMILTNDFTGMVDEQARYSPMCNENGGTVDDLIVYRMSPDKYFIVVNAANKDKDYKWMCDHQFGDVTFTDVSNQYAQIAVQGPKAKDIISRICSEGSIPDKYYHVRFGAIVAGIPCICSTTGYTGEDGVEIYLPAAKAAEMWDAIYEAGKDDGLIPCGLGARDTLRMEAGMPLYGHEMNDDISPREAGLMFAIKLKKPVDFIGKKPMEEAGKPDVVRVGLKITGRGIVREHQDVYVNGEKVGYTTSGTKCPYFDYPIAMARIPREFKEIGTPVQVDVRGRMVDAEVCELPFYKR